MKFVHLSVFLHGNQYRSIDFWLTLSEIGVVLLPMGMGEQTFEFEEGPSFHDWAATIKLRKGEERPFCRLHARLVGTKSRQSTNLWGETLDESHETNCRRTHRPRTQIGTTWFVWMVFNKRATALQCITSGLGSEIESFWALSFRILSYFRIRSFKKYEEIPFPVLIQKEFPVQTRLFNWEMLEHRVALYSDFILNIMLSLFVSLIWPRKGIS